MIRKPKGTYDKLPSDVVKWRYVEEKFKDIANRFGYSEIRTPTFEMTKLFRRGVGEGTDIVQKEMFTVISEANMRKHFEGKYDLKEKGFTLRPEGTAPVVRSYVENKLYADAQPTKLFYNASCFRNERPQAGRNREFNQFGVEVLGSKEAFTDAEVISVAMTLFQEVGVEAIQLKINSVGCPNCRPAYHKTLKDFIAPKLDLLCETCQDRYETNPLRILDCKNENCQKELVGFPKMHEHLCDECQDHFQELQVALRAMEIPFEIDPGIVRGLDYYTKTAFELVTDVIGAQSTVCGGGRYNGLVKEIGGPETPGVGFGLGVERLLLTMENTEAPFPEEEGIDVFLVAMGQAAKLAAMKILAQLRKNGVSSDMDHLERSIKAQFRYADKAKAKYTIVIGDQELEKGVVSLKNMKTSNQKEMKLEEIVGVLKEELTC